MLERAKTRLTQAQKGKNTKAESMKFLHSKKKFGSKFAPRHCKNAKSFERRVKR